MQRVKTHLHTRIFFTLWVYLHTVTLLHRHRKSDIDRSCVKTVIRRNGRTPAALWKMIQNVLIWKSAIACNVISQWRGVVCIYKESWINSLVVGRALFNYQHDKGGFIKKDAAQKNLVDSIPTEKWCAKKAEPLLQETRLWRRPGWIGCGGAGVVMAASVCHACQPGDAVASLCRAPSRHSHTVNCDAQS